MVALEHVETRAGLREDIAKTRADIAALTRRGHHGLHQSCHECAHYGDLHAEVSYLIACYLVAPA